VVTGCVSWFIRVLNGTGLLFLKLMGMDQAGRRHIHSPKPSQQFFALPQSLFPQVDLAKLEQIENVIDQRSLLWTSIHQPFSSNRMFNRRFSTASGSHSSQLSPLLREPAKRLCLAWPRPGLQLVLWHSQRSIEPIELEPQ
jgi:hypothetical protein